MENLNSTTEWSGHLIITLSRLPGPAPPPAVTISVGCLTCRKNRRSPASGTGCTRYIGVDLVLHRQRIAHCSNHTEFFCSVKKMKENRHSNIKKIGFFLKKNPMILSPASIFVGLRGQSTISKDRTGNGALERSLPRTSAVAGRF